VAKNVKNVFYIYGLHDCTVVCFIMTAEESCENSAV